MLCLILLVPAVPRAASVSQQELAQVEHSTPNLDRGAELFQACAACHGPHGGGTVDGQIPRIAGQHASVLRKQLVDYRHDRRWDLRMESVADHRHLANAQAIADVTAYVSQLPEEFPVGQGSGTDPQRGADIYVRMCRACHGVAAASAAANAVPRIARQHYEYLRRQIYDAVDGRRPNFSPAHIRLLARLDYEDIQAIADFLSRLGSPSRPQPAE